MALVPTIVAVFLLLVVSEVWWRRRATHNELSRKFIHITVGSFVAFWPFFLSWNEIKLLSLAFLIVVAISKYLHIFQAIHSVQRPTWGELWFAIAVGAIAFTTHNKWIYAAALLQMSLADGLAAVLGVTYGKSQRYKVFGQYKSVIGSLTFFIISVVILVGFAHYSPTQLSALFVVVTAALATLIENVAVQGLDNLLVPLAVALLLIH